MNILIIGGTRNVGHLLVSALLAAGHRVTTFNRGLTHDELPAEVERLHGDRSDTAALATAMRGRQFDAAVDMTLYNGRDAHAVVELLSGRVGHYVFISSGQVYLVRADLAPPFTEEDYSGALIPKPADAHDKDEWSYGIGKREAEDALEEAWRMRAFSFTALRIPMVNSERDYRRIYDYWIRIRDGGPLLVPESPRPRLRHIYAADVVRAVKAVLESGAEKGRAYNIAQDESVTLEALLATVGTLMTRAPRIVRIDARRLWEAGLMPECSPFSETWMSELDNRRGKKEIGIAYTPLQTCIERLVAHFESNPVSPPPGYAKRALELALAREIEGN